MRGEGKRDRECSEEVNEYSSGWGWGGMCLTGTHILLAQLVLSMLAGAVSNWMGWTKLGFLWWHDNTEIRTLPLWPKGVYNTWYLSVSMPIHLNVIWSADAEPPGSVWFQIWHFCSWEVFISTHLNFKYAVTNSGNWKKKKKKHML